MTRLVFILFWLMTLLAGHYLASIQRDTSPRKADLVAKIFGESRALMGARILEKADVYFHSGVRPEDDCHEFTGTHHHDDADADHEDDHNDGEEPSTTAGDHHYAGPAWYRAVMDSVRPAGPKHLTSAREVKEVLPWIRLATDLDPHNVQGYDVGAYWLAHRTNAPAQAIKLINEGIANNPDAFELELTKGELLMDTDPATADSALAAAEKKWQAARKKIDQGGKYPSYLAKPDPLLLARIREFRSHCMVKLGHPQQAIDYLKQALQVSTNKKALQDRIRELSSQADTPDGVTDKKQPSPR